MKKILLSLMLLTPIFWSCNRDKVDPTIEGIEISDYDLIQVTTENSDIPVTITANDDQGIKNIEVNITPNAGGAPVGSAKLTNVTANSLNRFQLKVAFPNSNIAPSGLYKVNYTVEDDKDKKTTKSYTINVLNNNVPEFVGTCVFPDNVTAPTGKVLVQMVGPASTNGEDVYVSGNFEGSVGGCTGNWTGGGCAALKLTKVSNTCYYNANILVQS
jgi:hypothetical protein